MIAEKTPYFPMKKKFENFLKQLGDSQKKKRNISAKVRMYEKLRRLHYYFINKGGEIWMEKEVQLLKIINALFLEPHTCC